MSTHTDSPVPAHLVRELARQLGADAVGIAPSHPVATKELFLAWLAAGYAADMGYLHRYQDQRFDPRALLPGAESVVVVGLNYAPRADRAPSPFKVAKYAWGEDYHRVLRRLLRKLRRQLRALYPRLRGRLCVDTAPFPDKYWAVQAGLGWQGKHTNLVSREHGSFLVLGSLIIDRAMVGYDRPHADYCGTCDACLQVCPTSAFPQPYLLDARRCISFWTIESDSARIPNDVARHMDGWVFGCDACLDACPWNRFATPSVHPEMERSEAVQKTEAGLAGTLSDEEFDRVFEGSALTRAGQAGLLRNQSAAMETASPLLAESNS